MRLYLYYIIFHTVGISPIFHTVGISPILNGYGRCLSLEEWGCGFVVNYWSGAWMQYAYPWAWRAVSLGFCWLSIIFYPLAMTLYPLSITPSSAIILSITISTIILSISTPLYPLSTTLYPLIKRWDESHPIPVEGWTRWADGMRSTSLTGGHHHRAHKYGRRGWTAGVGTIRGCSSWSVRPLSATQCRVGLLDCSTLSITTPNPILTVLLFHPIHPLTNSGSLFFLILFLIPIPILIQTILIQTMIKVIPMVMMTAIVMMVWMDLPVGCWLESAEGRGHRQSPSLF